MVCLIVVLGRVVLGHAPGMTPRAGSSGSVAALQSNVGAVGRATAATPGGEGKVDRGGTAETGTEPDKLAAIARELGARLHSLSMNPRMRELVARRTAQDYAELFRILHLSAEKQELLSQILVDRFFSTIGPERDSYDQLTQDLLTPDEFEKYATYRDELPVKVMVKEVSAALKIDSAGAASEEIGRVIRSSSNRASRYWAEVERKFVAGGLSEAELAQEEQNVLRQFDQSVAREVRSLSDAQLAALRAWFRGSVRATVASIRQLKAGM